MNQLERFHKHKIPANTEKKSSYLATREQLNVKRYMKNHQFARKIMFIWHLATMLTAMVCCFEMYDASEKYNIWHFFRIQMKTVYIPTEYL